MRLGPASNVEMELELKQEHVPLRWHAFNTNRHGTHLQDKQHAMPQLRHCLHVCCCCKYRTFIAAQILNSLFSCLTCRYMLLLQASAHLLSPIISRKKPTSFMVVCHRATQPAQHSTH
jgi:hypothetical protein